MAPRRTPHLQGSQTLARGLRVLQLLADAEEGMTASSVAQALSVHQSIAYRVLHTLAQFGLARRDQDGRYRVGVGVIALSQAARSGLRSAALPVIRTLAEQTHCTSWLFVREGEDAVALLAVAPGPLSRSLRFWEGSRHPLTRGSAGYALWSLLPPGPDDPEKVLGVRKNGYVMTHAEIDPNAWGVASPLESETGLHACVLISADDQAAADAAIPYVRAAAHDLSEYLRRPAVNGQAPDNAA